MERQLAFVTSNCDRDYECDYDVPISRGMSERNDGIRVIPRDGNGTDEHVNEYVSGCGYIVCGSYTGHHALVE